MTTTVVDLGSLKLSSRDTSLTLTLSSTCCLLLPCNLTRGVSPDELSRLVKAGQLWIYRAGTCRLGVLTNVDGDNFDPWSIDSEENQSVVEAVGSCQVSMYNSLSPVVWS